MCYCFDGLPSIRPDVCNNIYAYVTLAGPECIYDNSYAYSIMILISLFELKKN